MLSDNSSQGLFTRSVKELGSERDQRTTAQREKKEGFSENSIALERDKITFKTHIVLDTRKYLTSVFSPFLMFRNREVRQAWRKEGRQGGKEKKRPPPPTTKKVSLP